MTWAPVVTLTTDFGLADPYVAEVKAMLLAQWRRWPEVAAGERTPPPVVDVSHAVPPGDVAAAAWLVARTCPRFPAGAVHVAVVDPGVGTDRPAVAARAGGHLYVAPGNGLLAHLRAAPDLEVVRLDVPLYHAGGGDGPAPTFHGRDLFAVVAAHLAAGVPLAQVGTPAGAETLGELPRTEPPAGALGRVVWVDRFGNAITDIPAGDPRLAGEGVRLRCGDAVATGPYRTFGAAPPGVPFWYRGSGGTVELAARDADGAARWGWRPGRPVLPAAKENR